MKRATAKCKSRRDAQISGPQTKISAGASARAQPPAPQRLMVDRALDAPACLLSQQSRRQGGGSDREAAAPIRGPRLLAILPVRIINERIPRASLRLGLRRGIGRPSPRDPALRVGRQRCRRPNPTWSLPTLRRIIRARRVRGPALAIAARMARPASLENSAPRASMHSPNENFGLFSMPYQDRKRDLNNIKHAK
jgi:hypothetical protein